MRITLKNDFHNSSATVLVPSGGACLSEFQQEYAERKLCGIADCQCGGLRGPQDLPDGWMIDLTSYDRWYIGPQD